MFLKILAKEDGEWEEMARTKRLSFFTKIRILFLVWLDHIDGKIHQDCLDKYGKYFDKIETILGIR